MPSACGPRGERGPSRSVVVRVPAPRLRADGVKTDIVVCAPHGDRLGGAAAAWMQARQLRLAFLDTCGRNGGVVRA